MKVKELKKLLEDFNENLPVQIALYENIGNEDDIVFFEINGIEQLTSGNKKKFVSIFHTE